MFNYCRFLPFSTPSKYSLRLTLLALAAASCFYVSPLTAQTTGATNQPQDPEDPPSDPPIEGKGSFWLADSLVHGHLALSQAWIDRPEFPLAPSALSAIGAPDYVTRHVKGGDEGPWWNSAIAPRHCSRRDIGCKREPAREIANAQQGTKRTIAYYRHVWEEAMAVAHPDWVCVDEMGNPQIFDKDRNGIGQKFLSLSSPHKDVVKQRLIELVRMGYEAIYFDFKHQPEEGCWDSYTRNAYTAATGRSVPTPAPGTAVTAELSNPGFRSYLSFNNRQIGAAFREWQAAVREVNPNATLIVSTSYLNSLTTAHLSTNIIPAGSLAKTEFRLPIVTGPKNGGPFYRTPQSMPAIEESSRMAFGYSMLRSATFNAPPHVWLHIGRFDPQALEEGEKVRLPPTQEELSRGIAAILGLGGIANTHIDNEFIMSPSLRSEYSNAFAVAKTWSEKIGKRSAAVSHVGVFFSERLRFRTAGTQEGFWFEGNLPALASHDVANELGVPTEVVVDRGLSRGLPPEMKVLILTHPAEQLTEAQASRLAEFTARGGEVIDVSERSWAPNAYVQSRTWLANRLRNQSRRSFVRVLFPESSKQRTFKILTERGANSTEAKILLIPNDYSWVQRLSPADVNVESVVKGITLAFPAGAKAPEVVDLTGANPKPLTAEQDPSSREWTVKLPAFRGDLGIYSLR